MIWTKPPGNSENQPLIFHPKDHWTLKTGVILRTKTPLLYRVKPFHWRVRAGCKLKVGLLGLLRRRLRLRLLRLLRQVRCRCGLAVREVYRWWTDWTHGKNPRKATSCWWTRAKKFQKSWHSIIIGLKLSVCHSRIVVGRHSLPFLGRLIFSVHVSFR